MKSLIIAVKSNTMPYYVTCLELWTQGRAFDCLLLTFEETLHIVFFVTCVFLQNFVFIKMHYDSFNLAMYPQPQCNRNAINQ